MYCTPIHHWLPDEPKSRSAVVLPGKVLRTPQSHHASCFDQVTILSRSQRLVDDAMLRGGSYALGGGRSEHEAQPALRSLVRDRLSLWAYGGRDQAGRTLRHERGECPVCGVDMRWFEMSQIGPLSLPLGDVVGKGALG